MDKDVTVPFQEFEDDLKPGRTISALVNPLYAALISMLNPTMKAIYVMAKIRVVDLAVKVSRKIFGALMAYICPVISSLFFSMSC